jgi:hypothetical protein
LETGRQYALEKLGESGEADQVRGRHRDHYTAMADQLDAPAGTSHENRLAQAAIEIDNLRAAFAWSHENGDHANALELASALQPLWLTRGRISEGLAWLDAAGAEDQLVEPAILARAIADKAVLSSWVDVADMVERVQIALPIARDIGDPALLLRVLTACACVTAHDADLARPYFTEAAELARESNDSWRLTQILGRQAYGAMVAGDVIEARSLAKEGRELAEAIGDDFNSRQCLMYVAWANMCRGETTLAVTQFGEMVAEATRAHDVMSRVAGLICEGFALAWHGDVERARTTAAQTLEACAELGFLIQNGYMTLVIAELVAGNPAAALEASETAIRSSTNSAIEGANLVWFSQAALACGDTARATSALGAWSAARKASAASGLAPRRALTPRSATGSSLRQTVRRPHHLSPNERIFVFARFSRMSSLSSNRDRRFPTCGSPPWRRNCDEAALRAAALQDL